jgi:hypothetical protein
MRFSGPDFVEIRPFCLPDFQRMAIFLESIYLRIAFCFNGMQPFADGADGLQKHSFTEIKIHRNCVEGGEGGTAFFCINHSGIVGCA